MSFLYLVVLAASLSSFPWAASYDGNLKGNSAFFQAPQREDLTPNPPLEESVVQKDDIKRNFISATLGSNMVIQRDKEATLWGYSKPGSTIQTQVFRSKGRDDGTVATPEIELTSVVGDDGLWRQVLDPHPASMEPQSITVTSDNGETQTLENVLFGDVYICGGQSNMQFSIPGTTNATAERQKANNYPHIRLFTVGVGTAGTDDYMMPDLQTVTQHWAVANNMSLGNTTWDYFSSVCWFFGKEVADGLNNTIPIGLISNNWGGTKVQLWKEGGHLYNAMIHPYMVGPMALTGFTWYQGEANKEHAEEYAHLFPEMIQQWRKGFNVSDAYFGFVQLSTWCPDHPEQVAQLREAQMAALQLTPEKNHKGNMVGYATNADHGFGCNIHPPSKQYCGARLGKSALALQYGQDIHWKSPSYKQHVGIQNYYNGKPVVIIELQDVTSKGLYVLDSPYNNRLDPKSFQCKDQIPGTCAGAEVLLNGKGWVNATISIKGKDKVVLTVADGNYGSSDTIVATSYGWGAVPMLSIYDAGSDLPVLPWRGSL